MTPAEELRAAAARLRALAADATPGPWSSEREEHPRWGDVGWDALLIGGHKLLAHFSAEYNGPLNTDYAAAMHPGVGVAVADMLDQWAWLGSQDPDLLNRVGGPEALAVARFINQEQP